MAFSDIIDKVAPILVILLVSGVLYKALKPMFDDMGGLFKKMFGWVKDKGSNTAGKIDYDKVIVYR